MKTFRRLISCSLLLLWLPALTAGVLMVNTQEFLGGSKKPTTTKLRVESDRVRIETETGRGDVIIFRGDQQVMWIIDNKAKAYREMTKADVDRLGGQVIDMMAKMREQMEKMPPQQREMVEKNDEVKNGRHGGRRSTCQDGVHQSSQRAGDQSMDPATNTKVSAKVKSSVKSGPRLPISSGSP